MNASPNKGGRPRKVIKPFPPLEQVTSPTVDTDAAAYYLNRRPQTLRGWSQMGIGPLQPAAVIKRRLAWPVADIRRLLGIEVPPMPQQGIETPDINDNIGA